MRGDPAGPRLQLGGRQGGSARLGLGREGPGGQRLGELGGTRDGLGRRALPVRGEGDEALDQGALGGAVGDEGRDAGVARAVVAEHRAHGRVVLRAELPGAGRALAQAGERRAGVVAAGADPLRPGVVRDERRLRVAQRAARRLGVREP
ncbi:hypothetical protein BFL36_00005 [Clavibacter michiganensis]|uniref:Uncharacterized protein n=1 Tax=Clavibacter michiganensis TaxID=28447 RepID=A0A251YYJ9_9MICO|nr:hypothetical protein BFL36_00005 [Clavibacter michiganensis]